MDISVHFLVLLVVILTNRHYLPTMCKCVLGPRNQEAASTIQLSIDVVDTTGNQKEVLRLRGTLGSIASYWTELYLYPVGVEVVVGDLTTITSFWSQSVAGLGCSSRH